MKPRRPQPKTEQSIVDIASTFWLDASSDPLFWKVILMAGIAAFFFGVLIVLL
jgi:hypothetical protein